MNLVYFDLIGGASGDMILGALLDAGLALDDLRSDLQRLNLPGWSLEVERVSRRGISATHTRVDVTDAVRERSLSDILALLSQSTLAPNVRATSEKVLRRLGEVEARIHDVPLESVHLHELGGIDTIVDVVGAVGGLARLGVQVVYCSPFPVSRGLIQIQHGTFPLPAPATSALLQERNAPIVGVEGNTETVTPTGAAILTTLAAGYGELPAMALDAVGYGAGTRDDAQRPNLLRVFLGASDQPTAESLSLLETNLDDLNPQFYERVMARLFERGALDVTLSPLQMKKNRPGTVLAVLCRTEHARELRDIIFEETTTLGVREQAVRRYSLPRETLFVETRFGILRAKVAQRPRGRITVAPEYDDCVLAAKEYNVPLGQVWEEVVMRASATLARPGSD